VDLKNIESTDMYVIIKKSSSGVDTVVNM